MCIPIDPDMPVRAADDVEIGTAREILCGAPHEDAGDLEAVPIQRSVRSDDLWLRTARPDGADLYIPFGEIAETRADGVRLRVTTEEAVRRGWDAIPPVLQIGEPVAV
ncbi:MAG: DUF2171 domain-containing protein [Chloroflexota bacterium]|nr:DUF2171 domain-containing protein [Chloroflexota bacterium]